MQGEDHADAPMGPAGLPSTSPPTSMASPGKSSTTPSAAAVAAAHSKQASTASVGTMHRAKRSSSRMDGIMSSKSDDESRTAVRVGMSSCRAAPNVHISPPC